VVAINKVDKADANVDKTLQELSQRLGINSEEWGGKTVCAKISALKGEGINELLDMVLLVAETESVNIKANPDSSAVGTIVESHVDKGAGPVATILVQNGTLRTGDQLMLNGVNIGKVRGLKNYLGEIISEALPATPVQIVGLKSMPQVGDMIEVGIGTKGNFKKIRTGNTNNPSSSETDSEDDKAQKINLIIKSDVLGSAEAIEESLEKINTKEVKVKIIHKGLGNITDGDIKQAEASKGRIIGFNVKLTPTIEEMARERNVKVVLYKVIYDLINDIKAEMKTLIVPKYEKVELGKLKVLAIFRTEKGKQIIGGKVIEGRIENGSMIDVYRNKEFVGEGKLTKLQAGKQNVPVADKDEECGLQYEGSAIVLEGDVLSFFKTKEIKA
jgi:translation initiation factor IF-2